MSTTFEHDPAFPYLVVWGEYASARFAAGEAGLENAHSYAEETAGKVIDTTPIQEGYYLHGKTGIYNFYQGKWRDPANGWQETDYPNHLEPEELVRLVPES